MRKSARVKRPLGHDVVVAALLLLSCADRVEKEVSRETTAKLGAPFKAHVEHAKVEITHTAGCGCAGGGGGRGSVPLPSCENSRCTSETRVDDRCTVFVERDKPSSAPAPCGRQGDADLAVAPDGVRLAVRGEADWWVYAGGWGGQLTRLDGENGVTPLHVEKLDWDAIPDAREIFRRHLVFWLEHDEYANDASRKALGVTFDNLARVSQSHIAEDLVALASHDEPLRPCKPSTWSDAYERQPPEVKAEVQAKLAPGLTSKQRVGVIHAIWVLDAKGLVRQAGDPPKFLADNDDQFLASAAVLDAWSQLSPGAAGAFACDRIGRPLAPEIEDAALTAIARAGRKCDAVTTLKPRHCAANFAKVSPDLKPARTTALCEPGLAYVYAQIVQDPKFNEASLRARCQRLRDAAPPSDGRAE